MITMHDVHQSAISAALKLQRHTKSACLLKDADCCGPVKRHFKCLSAALSSNRHKWCSGFIGLEVEEWEMRWETRSDCQFLLADTSALSELFFYRKTRSAWLQL